MSSPINLISLIGAYNDLSNDDFISYINSFGASIKDYEVDCLKSLCKWMYESSKDSSIFDHFYVGYKIKQIGKEFDLLRIDEKSIVNIELKSENTGDKIINQLIKNEYYLKFLEKELYLFTYVSSENKLYKMNEFNTLEEESIETLTKILLSQECNDLLRLDNQFDPSKYLVSPFNSTTSFINGEYFLTQEQNQIKNEILSDKHKFSAIEGKSGTGKTLLAYDIMKELKDTGKKIGIIHCGKLNQGHGKLITKYNWNIKPILHYSEILKTDLDYLLIDEVQRIKTHQYHDIISTIQNEDTKCIFSYDPGQCLHSREFNNNIPNEINKVVTYKKVLKGKIRSNEEIASFLKNFFDLNKVKRGPKNYRNIEVHYFSNMNHVEPFIKNKIKENWTPINYTTSTRNIEKLDNYLIDGVYQNAHDVIGQEFDKVLVVIGEMFTYNHDKKLISTSHSYYHTEGMLLQLLTRARKKICLVIVNNETMLKNSINILN